MRVHSVDDGTTASGDGADHHRRHRRRICTAAIARFKMEIKTCSVLLVEDDESVRHLVATFLRRHCSSVDTASDGEEAISLVRRNRYDTVVLDIMLPKANGFQVAQAVRSLEHPPRIVVLSAVAGHFEDRFPADTILIEKPFDFSALIDAVIGSPD